MIVDHVVTAIAGTALPSLIAYLALRKGRENAVGIRENGEATAHLHDCFHEHVDATAQHHALIPSEL